MLFGCCVSASADEQTPISSAIFDRLSSTATVLTVTDENIKSEFLLKKFYAARSYQPAWIKNNHATPAVKELLNAVRQADREGLRPVDYHLVPITKELDALDSSMLDDDSLAQFEILLTDAFLCYGSDLVSGHTNPYDVDDDWFAGRRTGDLPLALEQAFDSGNIRATLRGLLPTFPLYQRMREALARYRQIEKNGGWTTIPSGKTLKIGDRDARIKILRNRLYVERDLNQKPINRPVFDTAVQRGLKHFQARMGLDVDGVLGEETLKALNVPVSDRVKQIRINMERCRWLPADLGKKHIFVNVPSFTLQIMENMHETMRMKVVVGRKMRQTPVFSSTMTQITLNPPWSVPIMVARLDILDHIREEPDYLTTHNFEVFDGYEDDAQQVDPATIDWTTVTPQNLHYKFRQKPGPLCALGQIKFLLPNKFDVYLHDTSSRSLFSKTVRDFSSGCIRVEKPVELAAYVLKGDSRWTHEKIEAAIAKNTEQTITLPEKLPVHLMYLTSWVDESGVVQFREDIYGRDVSLNIAINREPSL